jgi:hypothetical protein
MSQEPAHAPATAPGRRTFMPWWGVLGWVLVALATATWLVEGGRGLSVQGVVLLAVGAAAGVAGVVVWAMRTRRA